MRVPSELANQFGASFEELITQFSIENGLLPDSQSISSTRFLSRSVVPHIKKLSTLFNRIEQENQNSGLNPYWKESANPAHLRLAYFLYFMPCNMFRCASVFTELSRLGFQWNANPVLRGIEFGAGPAPGTTSAALANQILPFKLPHSGSWALIEQDKNMLRLGKAWVESYIHSRIVHPSPESPPLDWEIRPFHRKISLSEGFLPRNAPKFNLWIFSFFLNEFSESPTEIAESLMNTWERHLEENGIVIIIEPALKMQSRKLLEIRKELIQIKEKRKNDWLKILLPCLGEQSCGALSKKEDWCHEEVSWWRPPYFRIIDQMAELDRKTLPFSYLVLTRSEKNLEEILPRLSQFETQNRYRLVSPAHSEGRDLEFFVCGEEGKRRARYRPVSADETVDRGDILVETKLQGEPEATRINETKRVE